MLRSLAGLSLRDLEYAVSVRRLGRFNRAAEDCAVSQPTLSEQVRKLEALLGVTLFERYGRKVTPTAQGQRILDQAEVVITAARALLEVAASPDASRGPLRLGAIPTLGPYLLPHAMGSIRAEYPDLSLRVTEAQTEELVGMLKDRRVDVILASTYAPTNAFHEELLFHEAFHCVCPKGHPVSRLPAVSPAKLDCSQLLLLKEGHCLRDQTLDLCSLADHQAEGGRFASSLEMLRHMIAAGEGFSFLPALALLDQSDMQGLLHIRPMDALSARRPIYLLWRVTDPRRHFYQEFAGFLRKNALENLAPAIMPDALAG